MRSCVASPCSPDRVPAGLAEPEGHRAGASLVPLGTSRTPAPPPPLPLSCLTAAAHELSGAPRAEPLAARDVVVRAVQAVFARHGAVAVSSTQVRARFLLWVGGKHSACQQHAGEHGFWQGGWA